MLCWEKLLVESKKFTVLDCNGNQRNFSPLPTNATAIISVTIPVFILNAQATRRTLEKLKGIQKNWGKSGKQITCGKLVENLGET